MFCSTVIPTIARATLSRAVQSVLDQSFSADDFEVIVVNDSGRPLPPAEWQQSPRVRIIDTQRRERCVARNTGAAIAKGQYLNFLDDDDWLLPTALQTFWELAQTGDAAWLYGGCELVDNDGGHLSVTHLGASGNVLAQVMSPQQWVPVQSSLIKAEAFFQVGGFHPALLVTQDITLCRQIVLHGDFTETLTSVACLTRGAGWRTTTDYARGVEYYRLGREINLNEPGVFSRMRASAHSGFWGGRIVRIYLASMAWNLRRRRVLTAANRALYGAASFGLAGFRLLSADFWRGIVSKPVSNLSF